MDDDDEPEASDPVEAVENEILLTTSDQVEGHKKLPELGKRCLTAAAETEGGHQPIEEEPVPDVLEFEKSSDQVELPTLSENTGDKKLHESGTQCISEDGEKESNQKPVADVVEITNSSDHDEFHTASENEDEIHPTVVTTENSEKQQTPVSIDGAIVPESKPQNVFSKEGISEERGEILQLIKPDKPLIVLISSGSDSEPAQPNQQIIQFPKHDMQVEPKRKTGRPPKVDKPSEPKKQIVEFEKPDIQSEIKLTIEPVRTGSVPVQADKQIAELPKDDKPSEPKPEIKQLPSESPVTIAPRPPAFNPFPTLPPWLRPSKIGGFENRKIAPKLDGTPTGESGAKRSSPILVIPIVTCAPIMQFGIPPSIQSRVVLNPGTIASPFIQPVPVIPPLVPTTSLTNATEEKMVEDPPSDVAENKIVHAAINISVKDDEKIIGKVVSTVEEENNQPAIEKPVLSDESLQVSVETLPTTATKDLQTPTTSKVSPLTANIKAIPPSLPTVPVESKVHPKEFLANDPDSISAHSSPTEESNKIECSNPQTSEPATVTQKACLFCDTIPESKLEFSKHVREHCPMYCPVPPCTRSFRGASHAAHNIIYHLRNDHNLDPFGTKFKVIKKETFRPFKTQVIPPPPRSESEPSPVKVREKKRYVNTTQCMFCSRKCMTMMCLQSHIKSHAFPRLPKCPYCNDYKGTSKVTLYQHIRLAHKIDPATNKPLSTSPQAKLLRRQHRVVR